MNEADRDPQLLEDYFTLIQLWAKSSIKGDAFPLCVLRVPCVGMSQAGMYSMQSCRDARSGREPAKKPPVGLFAIFGLFG